MICKNCGLKFDVQGYNISNKYKCWACGAYRRVVTAEELPSAVEALLKRIDEANDLHAVFTIKDSQEFNDVKSFFDKKKKA